MRELARHLLADPADVDDVVQDACVAAWRHSTDASRAPDESDGADRRPLEPWLARVVRNLAHKRRRGAARRAAHEQALAPLVPLAPLATVPTPDETVQRLDLQRALIEEVRALEEPWRTTILLRFLEGRTSADIAHAAGIPEATVRGRVKRGLAELRARLDRRLGGREAWSALLLPIALPAPAAPPALPVPPAAASTAVLSSPLVVAGVQGVLLMSVLAKIGVAAGVLTIAGARWWGIEGEDGRGPSAAPKIARAEEPAPLAQAPLAAPAAAAQNARVASAEPQAEVPASAPAAAPPTPLAAPATPPARVDVRFVDAEGSPWEGVRFEYEGHDSVATSSADGRAELELAWTWPVERSDAMPFAFVARRAGVATKAFTAILKPGATTHLGDVLLVPGSRVLGHVIDEQGTLDLARVEVGLAAVEIPDDDPGRRARHGSRAFDRVVTTRAARDGEFALEGVTPGRWRLWAHAANARYSWTEPFDVEEGRDATGLEIALSPLLDEDHIAGVVLDPDGNPVPRAKVLFVYSNGSESGTTSEVADELGRFDQRIQIDAIHGVLASDPEKRFDPGLAAGVHPGTLDLEVRLAPRSTVDVRLQGPDESVVAGASFQTSFVTDGAYVADEPEAELDAEGLYRLPTPPRTFTLDVRAPGFRPRSVSDLDPAALPRPLVIVLEPAHFLRGRVVFEGRPVENARLSLRAYATDVTIIRNGFDCLVRSEVLGQTTSDAAGRFELSCDVDSEVVLRANATGFAPGELAHLDPTEDPDDLVLELTRGGTLEGRVLVDEGQSAEGIIVGINRGDVEPRTLRSGPGGAYRFDGLTPGKWQVLACERELQAGSVTIMSLSNDDASSEPRELEWSCDVQAGRTTLHDLDLRKR
jgi:RNA polymerase sigma factor (sigma-70 family)